MLVILDFRVFLSFVEVSSRKSYHQMTLHWNYFGSCRNRDDLVMFCVFLPHLRQEIIPKIKKMN